MKKEAEASYIYPYLRGYLHSSIAIFLKKLIASSSSFDATVTLVFCVLTWRTGSSSLSANAAADGAAELFGDGTYDGAGVTTGGTGAPAGYFSQVFELGEAAVAAI